MSKKRSVLCLAVAVGATWSGAALAQQGPFPAGTFAISGEHLTGFYHTSLSASAAGVSNDTSMDHLALLGVASNSGAPGELPRLGFDGFVVDGLSLGGTVLVDYAAENVGATIGAGAVTANANTTVKVTSIGFWPRIGYALMFNDSVGIWPRAGVGYYHVSESPDQGNGLSFHFVSLSLEAPLIFELAKGFAITAGPTVEISLSGSAEADNSNISVDESYKIFGIAVGLLGWM